VKFRASVSLADQDHGDTAYVGLTGATYCRGLLGPLLRVMERSPRLSRPDRARRSDGGLRSNEAGQALVELALVLPIMLVLLLGLLDVGRGMTIGIAVQEGTGQAAHSGSTIVSSNTSTTAVFQRLIDASTPFLGGCTAPNSGTTMTCTSSGGAWTATIAYYDASGSSAISPASGGTVEVKAVGQIALFSGFNTGLFHLILSNITVQGDAQWPLF